MQEMGGVVVKGLERLSGQNGMDLGRVPSAGLSVVGGVHGLVRLKSLPLPGSQEPEPSTAPNP